MAYSVLVGVIVTLYMLLNAPVEVASYYYYLPVTSYDNQFVRQCANNEIIGWIQSTHVDSSQDRRFWYFCYKNYELHNGGSWSGYQNDYNEMMEYSCGANKAITGAQSIHSNWYQHRRWSFQCKSLNGMKTHSCYWTGYINQLDEYMNKGVPNTHTVLNGLRSEHSNSYQDDKWKMKICTICSNTVQWSGWSAWGPCSQTCTIGGAGAIQVRQNTCTNMRRIGLCGGVDCTTKTEQQACNVHAQCPGKVDGGWSCWGGWSACSVSCGIGTRTRTRTCNNPSPQQGGAACSGPSTQSEECVSTRFKYVANAGISGHDTKVLADTTSSECMMACLREQSFSCKSFEHRPFTDRCVLSSADRQTAGVTFQTGSDWNGHVYQERACAPSNNAETRTVPTQTPFADNCHTSDCYVGCGESPYGNEMRTGSEINVRGIRVDLYEALVNGGIPYTAGRVIVHAQTVFLTRAVDVKYDVVLLARQVFFSSSGLIRYKNNELRTSQCQTLEVDCATGRSLTLRSFIAEGRMDILAEGIEIAGKTCTTGRIISDLPKQDPIALRQAVACANVLRMKASTGHDAVANNILQYVQMVTKLPKLFTSQTDLISIATIASHINNQMALRNRLSERPLPSLSPSAYTHMLSSVSDMFGTLEQRYTTAFDASLSADTRLADIDALMKKAERGIELQKRKAKAVGDSLKDSKMTLDKLLGEFKRSSDGLEAARKKLERGVEEYKARQTANSVFGFFNAIVGVFRAVGQIIIGGLTGNVAMVMGGVGDIIANVAEIVKLAMDTIELTMAMNDLTTMADELVDVINSLEAPPNPGDKLMTIDKVADNYVKIVVWKNVKNMADTSFGTGVITEINGCADFRKVLADTASVGEALSNQVVKHADLLRAYLVETTALENVKAEVSRMTSLHATAKQQSYVSDDLLKILSEEMWSVHATATLIMAEFCDSYFYTNFKPCREAYTFKLSDRFHTLQVKTQRMAVNGLNSARAFANNPPKPYNEVYILTDSSAQDCTDPKVCPVTQLKQHRQVQFTIPVTTPSFRAHQRVRVEQVRVFLTGVTFPAAATSHKVYIQLLSDGIIKDRFQGKTYTFATVGRRLTYTHDYKHHTTTNHACVHSSVAGLLSQMTPFSRYSLRILNPASTLDLSGLTAVEVYFSGSSITDRSAPTYDPQLQFAEYGQSVAAGECLGQGRFKKRKRSLQE